MGRIAWPVPKEQPDIRMYPFVYITRYSGKGLRILLKLGVPYDRMEFFNSINWYHNDWGYQEYLDRINKINKAD